MPDTTQSVFVQHPEIGMQIEPHIRSLAGQVPPSVAPPFPPPPPLPPLRKRSARRVVTRALDDCMGYLDDAREAGRLGQTSRALA
jgi:hypothetical protein